MISIIDSEKFSSVAFFNYVGYLMLKPFMSKNSSGTNQLIAAR